ncbi:MAG: hypothetical protein IKP40_05910 [Clostridia bacterium]|nr:hypothetical protein [Clostridia bacterium]
MKKLLCVLLMLSLALPAVAARPSGSDIVSYAVTPVSTSAQNSGNENVELKLPRMLDQDIGSHLWYTGWRSAKTDSIPEFTFNFNGVDLKAVWIRNGLLTSVTEYWGNARPRYVTLRVYTYSGGYTDWAFTMEDRYDLDSWTEDWRSGYQRLLLGQTARNVRCVEMFISDWYHGTGGATYHVCITDVLFEGEPYGGNNYNNNNNNNNNYGYSYDYNDNGYDGYGYGSNDNTYYGSSDRLSDEDTGVSATVNSYPSVFSGPGTNYLSLSSAGLTPSTQVTAVSCARSGNEYWVQVSYTVSGSPRRAYLQERYLNVDINQLPEEGRGSLAYICQNATGFQGPSRSAPNLTTLSLNQYGYVIMEGSSFSLFEFIDRNDKLQRVWVENRAVRLQ